MSLCVFIGGSHAKVDGENVYIKQLLGVLEKVVPDNRNHIVVSLVASYLLNGYDVIYVQPSRIERNVRQLSPQQATLTAREDKPQANELTTVCAMFCSTVTPRYLGQGAEGRSNIAFGGPLNFATNLNENGPSKIGVASLLKFS